MIYVFPKLFVWLLVLGAAYMIFGPQGFDSSHAGDPLNNASSQLFLPPAKSERLLDYEQRLNAGQLQPDEYADYQAMAKEHQSRFWDGDGISVEEAIAEIKTNRGQYLASMLTERGLTREEQSIFFTVLNRDRPRLLEDRQ